MLAAACVCSRRPPDQLIMEQLARHVREPGYVSMIRSVRESASERAMSSWDGSSSRVRRRPGAAAYSAAAARQEPPCLSILSGSFSFFFSFSMNRILLSGSLWPHLLDRWVYSPMCVPLAAPLDSINLRAPAPALSSSPFPACSRTITIPMLLARPRAARLPCPPDGDFSAPTKSGGSPLLPSRLPAPPRRV